MVARFDDPDLVIAAKAVAALMNPGLASLGVEPAVRRKQARHDPGIRQQVGNVLAGNAGLRPPRG